MALWDTWYFGCLGPDNHPPQYSIYLVPDIGNVSMGLVPGSYFEYLGPDIQYPIYLVPDIRNVSMGLVPGSYFEYLGPDNYPPQYPIYLVPDIGKGLMGLVPTFIIDVWD